MRQNGNHSLPSLEVARCKEFLCDSQFAQTLNGVIFEPGYLFNVDHLRRMSKETLGSFIRTFQTQQDGPTNEVAIWEAFHKIRPYVFLAKITTMGQWISIWGEWQRPQSLGILNEDTIEARLIGRLTRDGLTWELIEVVVSWAGTTDYDYFLKHPSGKLLKMDYQNILREDPRIEST